MRIFPRSARLVVSVVLVSFGASTGCSSSEADVAEPERTGTAGRGGSGGVAGSKAVGGAAGAAGLAGSGPTGGEDAEDAEDPNDETGSGGAADDELGGAGGFDGEDAGAGGLAGQGGNAAAGWGGGGAAGSGGVGTAGAGGGGVAGASGKAGGGGSGTADVGLPTSLRFDLDDASDRLFWKQGLQDPHHLMQSFAIDNKNRRMYFAQLRDGGSGDDLCITETDLSGNVTGHMYHNNAGHGVSIGVESVGKDSYLWVETDSHKNDSDGRGTALLRFKFVDGKTPSGTKFLTKSSTITAATDPINGRIVIRRRESDKFVFRLYTLAAAAKGDFSKPLAKFNQPALGSGSPTFQGYTIYGQYLYTLDGNGQHDPSKINSYVTRIDMKTGKVQDRALTKAGNSLIFREPEGMAVYTSGSETRLCIGLGSHDKVGGSNRWANVYFKNKLIP